jgi:hypothetical protein
VAQAARLPRIGALPLGVVPRGLRREQAAQYLGVSPTKFDQMVADGRAPKPKHIDGCRVWDVRALDLAFDRLDGNAEADDAWGRMSCE